MFDKKSVSDVDVSGKTVLVRVDFNVPIKDGKVSDDTRIQAALPTIQYLLDNGTAVILCSHLGRPKGEPDPQLSLQPVAIYLDDLIDAPVSFVEDCIGPLARKAAEGLSAGEVLLLENTRFHVGERENDPEMARQLASLADVFVNDAFGSAHRAHASTEGVAHYIPGVAGFLMEKEIKYLGQAVANPEQPFIVILGGAKVTDKIGVIRHLLTRADYVLIGGGMANTFFKAQGFEMAESLVELEVTDTAKEILNEGGNKLRLPVDVVIADGFDNDAERRTIEVGDIPKGWRILDVGSETLSAFASKIKGAGTVVWNGPMGVFEFPNFAQGTFELARLIADSGAISIVGGGDSAAAVREAGVEDKVSHVSTGGGASLQMLEGKTLPGLAALQDKE